MKNKNENEKFFKRSSENSSNIFAFAFIYSIQNMTLVILKKTNCEGHTMKVKVVTRIQLQGTICTFIVRTQTYTASAWVFRSLSWEPDIVKESVSVSSSPSEKEKRRREKKTQHRSYRVRRLPRGTSCQGMAWHKLSKWIMKSLSLSLQPLLWKLQAKVFILYRCCVSTV